MLLLRKVAWCLTATTARNVPAEPQRRDEGHRQGRQGRKRHQGRFADPVRAAGVAKVCGEHRGAHLYDLRFVEINTLVQRRSPG